MKLLKTIPFVAAAVIVAGLVSDIAAQSPPPSVQTNEHLRQRITVLEAEIARLQNDYRVLLLAKPPAPRLAAPDTSNAVPQPVAVLQLKSVTPVKDRMVTLTLDSATVITIPETDVNGQLTQIVLEGLRRNSDAPYQPQRRGR